jgi:hypothetical protein
MLQAMLPETMLHCETFRFLRVFIRDGMAHADLRWKHLKTRIYCSCRPGWDEQQGYAASAVVAGAAYVFIANT